MSQPNYKAVDRALDALRSEDGLELPDPKLNERLLELAREQARPKFGAGRSQGMRRMAASIAVLLCLTGITLGATVGLEGLKSWWYSIVIDGQETQGTIDGEGTREVQYTTDDGYKVSVSVGRRELPGNGIETKVHVREEGEGLLEEDIDIVRTTPDAVDEDIAPGLESFPKSILDAAQILHTWTDEEGARKSLWMDRDPEGPGSRLLISELDSTEDLPVALILRTARPIATGGTVSIVELEEGSLEIEITDGHGWAMIFVLGIASTTSGEAPDEYTSPSGRVNVKLGE